MMDDVFNSPDESSIISSVSCSKYNQNMSSDGRRRPAAQRSAQRRLMTNNNSNNDNNTINRSQPYNNVAKSEPDLLDSKYMEFKRPWYNNPEYKGPRNQYYSTTSPLGSMQNIKYTSTTLPRDIYPPNYNSDIYEPSSRYSSTSRRQRGNKMLINQNSITASEPYENSAFHSFENLMEEPRLGMNSNNRRNNSNNVIGGPISGIRLSSSPESAFSSTGSSVGNHPVSVATGEKNLLSYDRNKTIKNRSRTPGGSSTAGGRNLTSPRMTGAISGSTMSYSPNRYGPNDDVEEYIQPTSVYKSSTSPVPMTRNYLNVQNPANRASSLSRSEYHISDMEETPRRSVGSDGVSQRSGGKNYGQHQHLSNPTNNYIDDKFIRKFSKRVSLHSLSSSVASGLDEMPDSTGHIAPEPGTPQAYAEALFYVFSYLDTRSLARCGAVNRTWNMISRTPVLWRQIRIKDATISPRTINYMIKWCTQVVEVSFQRIKSSVLIESHDSDHEEFKLNKIEGSLKQIFHYNRMTLRKLRIVDCNEVITGRVLWTASQHCPMLTKLVYLSRTHPLSQADLYPLGRGCPKIDTLIVPPGWPCIEPDIFNDACCETISKCWNNIKILCIGGKKVSHVGLIHIAKGCGKLQHLEIDHGPEITEDVSTKMIACGLRGLVKLDFTFTPVSPRAIMMFAQACPKLQHIGIHCNISNYFINHTTTKAKSDYNSMKTLFKRLKARPQFAKVLDINLDYDPEAPAPVDPDQL